MVERVASGVVMGHSLPVLPALQRDVPVPYYYQIAQILRRVIGDAGAADERLGLPTEHELARRFGVSRGVVRQALGLLEAEGLIVRERGRGTYARRRLQHDLARLCSVTDDLLARGWRPGTVLLGVRALVPAPRIARALRLREECPVWEVHRLRLADDEPVSLQWSYIPVALAPDLDRHDLSGSLWQLYEQVYGIVLDSGDQSVRVRAASPEEAGVLGIGLAEPLFVIDRVIYDPRGTPVQALESLWRGDRYDFQVRLRRG